MPATLRGAAAVFVGRFPQGPGPSALGVRYQKPPRYRVFGVTRDSAEAALGGCTVHVFETESGAFRGEVVSDANGNYSIDVTGGGVDQESGVALTFSAIAYLVGSPDRAGTTVNAMVVTEDA